MIPIYRKYIGNTNKNKSNLPICPTEDEILGDDYWVQWMLREDSSSFYSSIINLKYKLKFEPYKLWHLRFEKLRKEDDITLYNRFYQLTLGIDINNRKITDKWDKISCS